HLNPVQTEQISEPIYRDEILGSGRLRFPIPDKPDPKSGVSESDQVPKSESGHVSKSDPPDLPETQETHSEALPIELKENEQLEKTDEFPIEPEPVPNEALDEGAEVSEAPTLSMGSVSEERVVDFVENKIAHASDELQPVPAKQHEAVAEPVKVAEV